jgi:hypothetical protein
MLRTISCAVALVVFVDGGVVFLGATPEWISDGRIMSTGQLVIAKLLPKDKWIYRTGKRGTHTGLDYYVLETAADEALSEPHQIWVHSGFQCNIEQLFTVPVEVMMDRRSDHRHWGVVPKCYVTFNSAMNWLAFVLVGLMSSVAVVALRGPWRDLMAEVRNSRGG